MSKRRHGDKLKFKVNVGKQEAESEWRRKYSRNISCLLLLFVFPMPERHVVHTVGWQCWEIQLVQEDDKSKSDAIFGGDRRRAHAWAPDRAHLTHHPIIHLRHPRPDHAANLLHCRAGVVPDHSCRHLSLGIRRGHKISSSYLI